MLKIYKEPNIYLVGQSTINFDELERFFKEVGVTKYTVPPNNDTCMIPEIAGRLCYNSYDTPRPGGNETYLKHVLEVQHGSILEHTTYNFIFTGISRSLTHELVRHRAGFGFSQASQRYIDEKDEGFVLPPDINEDDEDWLEAVKFAQGKYIRLVSKLQKKLAKGEIDKTTLRKAARSASRSVLPECTATKIFVTANARGIRNFIELRSHVSADKEIRRLAIGVLKKLQQVSPNLFNDYTITEEGAITPYRKV